jgi:PAS domain-containing protein
MDLTDVITIAAAISAIFYFIKSAEKHDLTYVASGLSRTYLAIMLFTFNHFGQQLGLRMFDAEVAMLSVVLSDMLVLGIYLIGRKYVREIEYSKMVAKLKNLSEKFSVVIESSVTGYFTLDRKGNFEFVNQSLANLLGYSIKELLTKNIFDFIDVSYKSMVLGRPKFNIPYILLKSSTGKVYKTVISGGETKNGHDTITGSIIRID